MKVDSLHLVQFSVFEDVELAFSPGINVLLGTNGTGKSHAMKALYALVRAMEEERLQQPVLKPEKDAVYKRKLLNVFKPDLNSLKHLIHRGSKGPARISVVAGEHRPRCVIPESGGTEVHGSEAPDAKAVFLPSREVLSMYAGFRASYAMRELSFDETYDDVCLALSATVLRGDRYTETAPLRARIEAEIGGPVVLVGDRFFIRRPDGDMEINLIAEGARKLASVAHLIANGSLSSGTAFFWDEPEAGLNPEMVVLVVDILLELAERGVQIFVAMHDYLLSHKLSLLSEYRKRPGAPTRFFGFQKDDAGGAVTIASGDTLSALPQDAIAAEFLRHYDFERALFDEEGVR